MIIYKHASKETLKSKKILVVALIRQGTKDKVIAYGTLADAVYEANCHEGHMATA